MLQPSRDIHRRAVLLMLSRSHPETKALPYNTGNDDLYGLLHGGPTPPNAGT